MFVSRIAIALLTLGLHVSTPPEDWGTDPIPASGRADPRLTIFDEMMRGFLRENSVAGGVLALSLDGRLIYARGFGYADLETEELMQPGSLFRIASLSKPITAATIMLLVERDQISLDDCVLQYLDPTLYRGRIPGDARWADVTIRHLLQHTGGFDRELSGDPMFRPMRIAKALNSRTPVGVNEVIVYMLGQELDFDPGKRFAYSNFGYSLLGRVIERVTNEPYETAVRRSLLDPLGISSLRLGRSLESDRFEGEVRYHVDTERRSIFGGEKRLLVSLPYGTWNHEALDSHGGWVGSAPDLLRFARVYSLDGDQNLLSVESILESFSYPTFNEVESKRRAYWYGLGWFVRPLGGGRQNTWHRGFLPGAESLLVRRHDGLSWALFFNSRKDAMSLAEEIDPLVHEAAKLVMSWPDIDLFLAPAERGQPPLNR
jgi:CubicO group peptidase (beta-lactamase class C family)